jgi:hypothetical protein
MLRVVLALLRILRPDLSDILRIRPDGTGLTNMTNSSRKSEQTADWNPAWVNDIGP